jgi:hypothetical protein
MTKVELERSYANLLKDPLTIQLEELLKKPNIFKVLGLENYEIRHSSFLAWLLDPHETHQFGDHFLKNFLYTILKDSRSKLIEKEITDVNISHVTVRKEWNQIDLLVITNDFVVCIENKVWSGEHSDQLKRYKQVVNDYFPFRKKVFVFLSPYGKESSEIDSYVNLSYGHIFNILNELLDKKEGELLPEVIGHISDYCNILNMHIMEEDDKASRLAKRIYKEYHQLFDFVNQNRGDEWTELENIIINKIKTLQIGSNNELFESKSCIIGSKNRGYVRFLPETLNDIIARYTNANGWKEKEAFLFEIEIHHKFIRFKATTYRPNDLPFEYHKYSDKLNKTLSSKIQTPDVIWDQWHVYKQKDWDWDIRHIYRNWDESMDEKLNRILQNVYSEVVTITNHLLTEKEELLKLKKEIELV